MSLEGILRVLKSFQSRGLARLEANADDQLMQRRITKWYCMHMLIIYKLEARIVSQLPPIDGFDITRLKNEIGRSVANLVYWLNDRKIKLSEHEYRSLFNITRESWNTYNSRRKPKDVLDVVSIQRLSNEPFIDYMIDSIIIALVDTENVRGKVNRYLRYEIGLPT